MNVNINERRVSGEDLSFTRCPCGYNMVEGENVVTIGRFAPARKLQSLIYR